MNLNRLALGLAISGLVIGALWDTGPDPQLETAVTAPITVVITRPPSTTSSTTSTTSTTTTMPAPTTTAYVGVPADHVCYEWLPAMLEAGWPRDPDILATALTIMWRESRCTPTADSGPDHGLMQVNRYWCRPSKYSAAGWLQDRGLVTDCDSLFDPATNLRAALAIYLYSLDRNGDGFLPWTTYSGA
jgi:hypothetical protein